jgi:GTPase Era involved in 16S rRNA processing
MTSSQLTGLNQAQMLEFFRDELDQSQKAREKMAKEDLEDQELVNELIRFEVTIKNYFNFVYRFKLI